MQLSSPVGAMKDTDKTKEQLIAELAILRQRLAELEDTNGKNKSVKTNLPRSQQLLQSIIDNAPAVIYVKDVDGRYLLINSLYETRFGLDRRQVIGQTDYAIFPPETADTLRQNDRKVLEAGKPLQWEEVVPCGDKMRTYISFKFPIFNAHGIPGAVCGISTDITARQQAEQALQESSLRFVGILDIANEAIISIDEAQHITLFNKGAERIFGYTVEEAIGQPLDILLPERFIHIHRKHIADFVNAAVNARLMGERQEILGRRKNGEEFPAAASISKLEVNDTQMFTVVLRDITAQKQIEAEREKLIAQLQALNEAAQAINAKLSLEQVLHTIVQTAQSLVGTKYAALGVHDGQGDLGRFLTVGISEAEKAKIGAWPTGRGVLGLMLKERKSLIIPDVSKHPLAVGFPEFHPSIHSLLSVPIFSKDELLGVFYLSDKLDGSEFITTDQKLIEMLGRHAAIAIENARLYEKTQQLAILEERDRFARDLHDGIIQSIYGAGLALDQVKFNIAPENQIARKLIDASLKSLAGIIDELRNYIFDLRPQALDHKELETRLDGLIKELQVNTHFPIEATISPNISAYLTEAQASHTFHIAHEALANAARHAKPNHLWLNLTCIDGTVTLRVEDDGIGFELPSEIIPGHHGLGNMQNRAAQLGGMLKIDSAPRQGTRVTVTYRAAKNPGK